MASTTTILPTKQYREWKVQPKISYRDYETAWLILEKIGRKINRLWKIKKDSLEVLKEERR